MQPDDLPTHSLELRPYIEEPTPRIILSSHVNGNHCPKFRHDFQLSKLESVDTYWETLKYSCVTAGLAETSAFPGCCIPEVCHQCYILLHYLYLFLLESFSWRWCCVQPHPLHLKQFSGCTFIDMFVPFAISLVKCPCFATDKIYINICYNKCFLWYVLSIFLVRYTHLNLTLYVYICRKLHSVMSIYRRLIDPMCPCMWFVFRFEFFSSQFKLVHWQFMGMMLVT